MTDRRQEEHHHDLHHFPNRTTLWPHLPLTPPPPRETHPQIIIITSGEENLQKSGVRYASSQPVQISKQFTSAPFSSESQPV